MFQTITCSLVVVCFTSTLSMAAEFTTDSLRAVKDNIASKKAILVDVRDKEEWDKGHVTGAVFLPLSEIKKSDRAQTPLKELPKERIIYTHCVVGMRARKAADILRKQGYDVRPLKAGYIELIEAGFPDAKAK